MKRLFVFLPLIIILSLVGVSYGQSSNLALSGVLTSSGAAGGLEKLNDGNTDGVWVNGSVYATSSGNEPWITIDIGYEAYIETISIWNRTDCCEDRIDSSYVMVSSSPFPTDLSGSRSVASFEILVDSQNRPNPNLDISVNGSGRYIKIQSSLSSHQLNLAEVQVFGYVPLPNELLNGEFNSDLSNWVQTTGGFEWSSGQVLHNYGSGSSLKQNWTGTAGTRYRVCFDYDVQAGQLSYSMRGQGEAFEEYSPQTIWGGNSTACYEYTSSYDDQTIVFSTDDPGGSYFTIDNVFVNAVIPATPIPTPDLDRPPVTPDLSIVVTALPTPLATPVSVVDYDVFELLETDQLTMTIDFDTDDVQTLFSHMRGVTVWINQIPYLSLFFYGIILIVSLRIILYVVFKQVSPRNDGDSLPPSVVDK